MFDMKSAQHVFMYAAGSQNLLQGLIGQPLHRSAQTPEHYTPIPFERLIEFGLPAAGTVVLQQRLIGIGASRVLQPVLAGFRVLPDGIAFVIEAQQVLLLITVQPCVTGLRPIGQCDRLLIGRKVRVPQPLLAADFHWLEPLDKRRHLDRYDSGAGQHMSGAHQCQLREVDQDPVEVRRSLFLVTLAPVLDAFGNLGEHLRDHDAKHGFTQARHQHCGEIENIPADRQVTGQALEACVGIFVAGRYGDQPGIGDGLVPPRHKQGDPQIIRDLVGHRFCIGIFDRRFTPPRAHVQRFALMPGVGRETFFDPGEKQPLVLLRHKPAEKRLVIRISQLPQERLHERGQ
ncbi:hypothetical protein D3C75_485430 [compost metagenome]